MSDASFSPRTARRSEFVRRFLAALVGPEVIRRRAAQRRLANRVGSAAAPREDESTTQRLSLKQPPPMTTDVAAIRDALTDVELAVARLRSLGVIVELRIPLESGEDT